MLRRTTWRSWALPGVLFAVYIVLGLTWTPSGSALEWIYKTGALGATFAPLLLIGIYAASREPVLAKRRRHGAGAARL